MIEVHNKSAYQNVYNKLSTVFIDSYVNYRVHGYKSENALAGAKMIVQNFVSVELIRNKQNSQILVQAYKSLNSDSEIINKAIKYYQSMK